MYNISVEKCRVLSWCDEGRSDEVLREKTRVLIGPEPALVINRGLVNYWRGRVCVNPSLTALQHPLLSRPLYSPPSTAPPCSLCFLHLVFTERWRWQKLSTVNCLIIRRMIRLMNCYCYLNS